ncbi:fructokinase [Granulicella rosea]|uniref:Fructokinase n=1 Tax=Granulicella rosea TaxID=474952 RepID=A0A239IKX3_9BACT|nr:ROK family protein [Granulicella rosea]SNS94310.1 fructokinase [Granulicella rosea]
MAASGERPELGFVTDGWYTGGWEREQSGGDVLTRIGVDLGGTKIEALAMDGAGVELARYRVATPRGDYDGTVKAVEGLVRRLESEVGPATVGVGIPGTMEFHGVGAERVGKVKNANSTWLNGRPFDRDLSVALNREVRVANDANCFVVSEATDGAAAGLGVVFGVILGTGCGGGIALNGQVHAGRNGVAGEWGHMPLPWATEEEFPGPACFCGRRGCMEMWISGTGLMQDYERATGRAKTGAEIVAAAEAGEASADAALVRLEDRIARGLACIVDVLDPDAIVIGGGVSRIGRIYPAIAAALPGLVFGGGADTPVLQAKHGDSSGVRGAAWLWPLEKKG